MVILDEPFASQPLLQWLQASKHPVLSNRFARQMVHDQGFSLNLISEPEAIQRADAGERIYTCSENALAWILDNSSHQGLTQAISLFKDKGRMREALSPLTPGFFYRRVPRADLKDVSVEELPLPVVLKPNVGFCSMGVYVIQDAAAWTEALADIEAHEQEWQDRYPESVIGSEEYLIEGYIQGEEYALDAYYDEQGAPHILNIWRHDFAGPKDTSDRLYLSSKAIVDDVFEAFEAWLGQVNQVVGAKGFCVHVETRKAGSAIVPIEFNPLRFAGLGGTDMAYYGCGYRTYECYLEDIPLDLRSVYRAHPTDAYSMSLLGSVGAGTFDHERFMSQCTDVLAFVSLKAEKTGSYGFLFLRTPADDPTERDLVLTADLRDYLS